MRNGLEADERPRHHRQNAQDLGKRLRAGCERRRHRRQPAFVARKREEERDRHAREHEQRERRLNASGEPPAPEAHAAGENHYRDRKQNFAQIYVEPGEGVVPAELQNVAEHVSRQQHEGGRVRPQYRHVRERQRPRGEVAVVGAEGVARVRVRPAGPGEGRNHPVVVPADDGHRGRPDGNPDHGAERSGAGQKLRPGHDERAPSDGIAERQPPRRQHREMLLHAAPPPPPARPARSGPSEFTVTGLRIMLSKPFWA